ncbi:MAG: winged helix-turn-helix transcriptional regulator [Actinobacteria bacterium]|nr:winged helix-turn-helix transcriptional regulator [Actinomycetota bacterium]
MISTNSDVPCVGSLAQAGVPAAALFHSLSDPTRLGILCHLALGEQKVVDLVTHLCAAQSTVSKHLSCLRECGLVQSRAAGRASLYSLAVPEELTGPLAAAERLLAVTGDAVELCPTYGTAAAATVRAPLAAARQEPLDERRNPRGPDRP